MRVSVITAVRNGANVIASTVQSVASQTYSEIEHVFVDGGSSDGTVEVIRSLAARSPRVKSEPDEGVYDAFSKGLRLASGEVIGYLNAGDVYSDPDVITRIVRRFEREAVDAVFGDVAIVDARDATRMVRRFRSSGFSPAKIAFGFMPAHPALYMRRRVYEEYGPYDASYRIAGDFELVARVFGRGGISYSCMPEVLVRMARGGLSSSGLRSNWTITREMKRACEQNGIATSWVKLALRFPLKYVAEVLNRGR